MAAKTTATPWGDPSNNTFRKTNIREAAQGDIRVPLHKLVKPLAEELWAEWDQRGIPLTSVGPVKNDELGLQFHLDEDVQLSDLALEQADKLGWARAGDRVVFAGSPEFAKQHGEQIGLRDLAEMAKPWKPEPVEADHQPGSRTLKRGDKGDDVRFLQVLLGVKTTGEYDAATQKAMITYHTTHGLSDDGDADEWFWASIIPRVIRWKRMGEAGREIRTIESALVTFGYMAGPPTGRYGIIMSRALHQLRQDRGIAGATKVDNLVWGALFDLRFQRYGADLTPEPQKA